MNTNCEKIDGAKMDKPWPTEALQHVKVQNICRIRSATQEGEGIAEGARQLLDKPAAVIQSVEAKKHCSGNDHWKYGHSLRRLAEPIPCVGDEIEVIEPNGEIYCADN